MPSALLRYGWCSRGWCSLALQLGSSRSCCGGRVLLGMRACRFGKLLGVEAIVVLRLRSARWGRACCEEASARDLYLCARRSGHVRGCADGW
jgi:hypothetical protein